jgi:ribose 5-phosphate isomerase RpiB
MALRIVVGSDDAGYEYKEALKGDLRADSRVAEVTDVGVGSDEDTDYPHVAVAAADSSPTARPTARCWSAGPGWAWPSAPTR